MAGLGSGSEGGRDGPYGRRAFCSAERSSVPLMSEFGDEDGVSATPRWRPATAPDYRSDVEAARKGESQIYIESMSSRFWGLVAAWGLLGFAAFLLWVKPAMRGSMLWAGPRSSR